MFQFLEEDVGIDVVLYEDLKRANLRTKHAKEWTTRAASGLL